MNRQINKFWDVNRVEDWSQLFHNNNLLIRSSHLEAFRYWAIHNPKWVQATKDYAEKISKGRIYIFDQEYQFALDKLPWHTDWRCPYTWSPAYFRTYSFYIPEKESEYDVKFPWELSRFSFLLPLAQIAALTDESKWQDLIINIIDDWSESNPIAYSVNWRPMESAMRGIILSIVMQMLAAINARPEYLKKLLYQITLQGEFLFRNIEFSNLNNNHYTSNIVSLLIMGHTLQRIYKPAVKWTDYAKKRISPEIEAQYCEDGVNFEKSISYHRLVTELFILALILMDRANYYISDTAHELIRRACDYIRCYTRPDGLAPNWGDNDGARLLSFDPYPLRDHRSLIALGSAFFTDQIHKSAAMQPTASIPWLLGLKDTNQFREESNSKDVGSVSRLFQAGGMAISREAGNFLIADFGEVGLNSHGGHGHNDTLSFELSLCGQPLIVDPGSPIYTGNMTTLALYRSTRYHNTASVDGKEIARFLGVWRISGEAVPKDLQFKSSEEVDIIEGGHKGYTRLKDPVIHQRRLEFYKKIGRLVCLDIFHCNGRHCIERFLHFAASVETDLTKKSLNAYLSTGDTVLISWSPNAEAYLEPIQISENFGNRVDSQRLVLKNEIKGKTELSFEIVLQRRGGE